MDTDFRNVDETGLSKYIVIRVLSYTNGDTGITTTAKPGERMGRCSRGRAGMRGRGVPRAKA
jgi:hypothetical protein